MHVEEQVLEGRQVGAVVRCGQVTRQHDGHVPVEVEARVKPHVTMAPLSEEVEAHRVVEVGEVVAHGDRRRGEDDALHLGQPPAGKVGAHVELLGHEPLGRDAALGARELGRVHIGLVRPLADERNAREEVAKEPRGLPEVGRGRRGLLAQRLGGLRELLHRLAEHVSGALPGVGDLAPLLRPPHLLADPQRNGVIPAVPARNPRKAVDRNEQVGNAHRGAGEGRRGLGEKSHEQR